MCLNASNRAEKHHQAFDIAAYKKRSTTVHLAFARHAPRALSSRKRAQISSRRRLSILHLLPFASKAYQLEGAAIRALEGALFYPLGTPA